MGIYASGKRINMYLVCENLTKYLYLFPCRSSPSRWLRRDGWRKNTHKKTAPRDGFLFVAKNDRTYSIILETTPAPTVLPPSRIAKRRPSLIATGVISSTVIFTLSPGITIFTSSGRITEPVTSVVLK